MDWCSFFALIEEDPHRKVGDLTTDEYVQASKHIKQCKKCWDITTKVLEKELKTNVIRLHISEN